MALLLISACAPTMTRPNAKEYVYDYLTATAKYKGETYNVKPKYSSWVVETRDFTFAASLVPDYVVVYTDEKDGIAGGGPKQIEFDLKNKTQTPIEIIWASSSIVLPDGSASRVMHKGQKFLEKDRPAPPSIIPPNAILSDLAAPSDLIYWSDLQTEWVVMPMFRSLRKGQGITLLLTLNVGGQKEYFQVRWEASKTFPKP